ncbi:cytoplasm protein [Ceraceosorus bombacis]|uniref:Cytoplasm protein n=1 Tax=Ceraceosorus bombacis TaxID=401625 RepID=A0A0P1BLH8_9BASI|nr:cytoplasm protein [Ceraceosorus bombacis]
MPRSPGHNSSTSFSGSPSAASGEGAPRPSLSSSGSSFLRHFRPRTSDGRRNGSGFSGFGPFGNHSTAAVTSTQPSSPGAETEEMADLTRVSSTGLRANVAFLPRMVRRISLGTGRSEAADLAAARAPPARTNQEAPNGSRNVTPLPSATPVSAVSSPARPSDERTGPTASTTAALALNGATSTAASSSPADGQARQTHRIRLVPHLEATRSLHFEPIERDLVEGSNTVKIGRFTDRNASQVANAGTQAAAAATSASAPAAATTGNASNALSTGGVASNSTQLAGAASGAPGARGGAIPSSAGGGGRVDSARIAFKSKVVSRGHAEVWCESGGNFFIRDTKSSSGTFLNHIRLSAPNAESRPFPIKDGDVVQLGVDYQGGTEEIYRCVKMRVELNRGWQRAANEFNMSALRQLRALQGTPMESAKAKTPAIATTGPQPPTNRQSMSVTDCCICLFSVTVCQSLFIAPCSHVFHYKCIRPLLLQHHPGFSCPLCRTFADLEADVEQDDAWQEALIKEAEKLASAADPEVSASTPMAEIEPSPLAMADSTGSPLAHHSHQPSDSLTVAGSHVRRPAPAEAPRTNGWARPGTAVANGPAPTHSLDATAAGGSSQSRSAATPPLESPGNAGMEDEQEELMDEAADYANLIDEGDLAGLTTVAGVSESRRGSNPIDMPAGQQRHSFAPPIPSPSADLENARTPQNNTFLSTLAEAPAPARSAIRGAASSEMSRPNMPSLSAALRADEVPLASNEAERFLHASGDLRRPSEVSVQSDFEVFATPQDGNSPSAAHAKARGIPSNQEDTAQLFGASTPFAYASELDDGDLTGPSSLDGPSSQTHGRPSSTKGKRPLNLSVAEEEDELVELGSDIRGSHDRRSPYKSVEMDKNLSRASSNTSRSALGHSKGHERNSLGGSAGGSSIATGNSALDRRGSGSQESAGSTPSNQGKISRLLKRAQNAVQS